MISLDSLLQRQIRFDEIPAKADKSAFNASSPLFSTDMSVTKIYIILQPSMYFHRLLYLDKWIDCQLIFEANRKHI